jgi:diaminopimelate decarboxylase
VKDESDLEWAARNGVQITTADSLDELLKIKQYTPDMGVLWRIDIREEAADKISTPFSGKFGDDLDSEAKIHERMQEISRWVSTLREYTSTVAQACTAPPLGRL